MSINLPIPGLVDIRQPILGDSFGWAGLEPAAAKKSVVFHHSASDQPAEDGFSIADYHVNHNGWGGSGYHLVITRSDYPGRLPFTQPGAQIQYVGDLGTWRAHVLHQNPGRIGVCFVGMEPDEEQLKLGRQLMDFFVAPNNILPSINYLNQATVHQLVPGQSTECPGSTFRTWLPYLQGGPWPYASANDPQLPTSEPIQSPPTPEPGKGGDERSEYEKTWRAQPSKTPIQREGATAIDVVSGHVVATIPVGQSVDIAGYFDFQGHIYARTVYSATNGKWNGIDATYFEAPTGQVTADIPVAHPDVANPAPDPIVIPDEVQHATDQQLKDAVVPETPKLTWRQFLWEVFAQALAKIVKRIKS